MKISTFSRYLSNIGVALRYNTFGQSWRYSTKSFSTEDLKNAANEAAQAYENISSKINNLDSAADKIETLTKGTIEWKNAIAENNREVLDLLNSYDMRDSKYLDTSGDYYKITDLGKDEIQNRAYQKSRRATALYNASLLNTKEAEYAISENDTQVENRKSFNK